MSTIIKIKFDDGSEHKLPDVSYNKFLNYIFEDGMSDIAWENYLKNNNMVDIVDYNSDATKEMTLIVENKETERILKFKCIYDSDSEL